MSAGRIQIHEWSLGALAVALALALVVRAGFCIEMVVCIIVLVAFGVALCRSEPHSRLRLLASYGMAWAGYAGSSRVIEALRLPLHSAELLNVDRWLFGETPSVAMSAFHQRWIGDVLSLGYMSYLGYLHWALIDATFKPAAFRAALCRRVFTAFAVGLSGYHLFPAACPNRAHAGLYDGEIAGGWLTHFNEALNLRMAARYDAFPSLHILITLTLLAFDWNFQRVRFWTMLAPSLLMVAGTLALRLHYAADLLASLALFAGLTAFWRWRWERAAFP